MKRSSSPSRESVSPPPVKRKIESMTTSKAVASFFRPSSLKEPEKLTWTVVDKSLLVAKYHGTLSQKEATISQPRPQRIAIFDLDDTIIAPSTSNKWARNATSWKWWDSSIPERLRELHKEGYILGIISNQAAIKLQDKSKISQKESLSLTNFKNQVTSMLRQLELPINLYAATGQDKYRKPRTGMWKELLKDHDLQALEVVDLSNSFFIGDAAGRARTDTRRKDHSSSDLDFASNVGIAFKTPEEYFKNESSETYVRIFEPLTYINNVSDGDPQESGTPAFTKRNAQDLVLFCGSPGAGKSTFYWEKLKPLGYERVNQDTLKSVGVRSLFQDDSNGQQRDKCLKVAKDYLTAGRSVAVDNTNADVETRGHWIKIARDFGIPIRCVRFTAPAHLCEHNDTVRALNPKLMNPEGRAILPGMAFRSFASRFSPPTASEGFQDIVDVNFTFQGTAEQQKVWTQYWVSKFSA